MDLGEALSSRGLGQYFPRFTENEIDLDALSLLKTDDLVGLGIAEADRPPLLLLIKDLQPRGSEAASTPAPARPSPESVAALVSKMVTLGLGAAVSQEALAGCDFDLERAVDLAFSCGGDAKAVAQSFGRAPSTCGGAPAGGGEPDEAAVARHFAAADEAAAGDEDLPWAPSGWLEGDSLAPPCASDLAVVDALLSLARVGAADTVADLGAGDGRVCVRACLSRGAAAAWGVEIDEDEAAKFAANVAAFGLAGRCRVERGDLLALAPADLEGVTVLALYLLPEAIQAIRPLLDEALDVLGLRVVANTWGLPWREPAASTQAGAAGTPLFLYRGAGAAAAIAPDAAEPSGSGKVLSAEAKPFAPPPALPGTGDGDGGDVGEWSTVAPKNRRGHKSADGGGGGGSAAAVDTATHLAAVDAFVASLGLGASGPPVVIVMRALPGCGKSTLAARLAAVCAEAGRHFEVCSADHFFEDPSTGRYNFDPTKLGAAHAQCSTAFAAALALPPSSFGGGSVVVIDNTNTTTWEYRNYLKDAAEAGASSHVIELALPTQDKSQYQQHHHHHHHGKKKFGPGQETLGILRKLAERNAHGVPLDALVRMHERWENDPTAFKVPIAGL